MTVNAPESAAQQALDLLRAGVDAVRSLDLAQLSSVELLELLRGLEIERHRSASTDHTVVAEIEQRGVAGERACRDTVTLLALLLRVDACGVRRGLLAVLGSGQLPATGGVTTTIVLTMTPEQLGARQGAHQSARGLVPTRHGSLMSLGAAQSLLGDAQLHPVLLGSLKRIDAYGDTHRIFTAGQRLALIAREHGCSFPGCTVGPAWCRVHHVVPFALEGKTSVDNGTLLCGYHHRYFAQLGYRCDMRSGVPWRTAPAWIDRSQRAVRNTAHLPEPEPL